MGLRWVLGGRADGLRWQLRPPDTLSVSVSEGTPPTRDEVAHFLGQIRPVVEAAAPRVVVVDGEALRRRKGLSFPEVAGQIMYEAARARTARSAGARCLRPPR